MPDKLKLEGVTRARFARATEFEEDLKRNGKIEWEFALRAA